MLARSLDLVALPPLSRIIGTGPRSSSSPHTLLGKFLWQKINDLSLNREVGTPFAFAHRFRLDRFGIYIPYRPPLDEN